MKLRTGVVIGREGGMIQSIWLPFMLGVGGPMGSGKQILPWIHLEDLCRLIQHCLENEKCTGAFNAVAPEIVTNEQFSKVKLFKIHDIQNEEIITLKMFCILQAFASALHRPCMFNVPEFAVNLLFGNDRSALLLSGAKIQPENALNTGFKFNYPTAKAACLEVLKKS